MHNDRNKIIIIPTSYQIKSCINRDDEYIVVGELIGKPICPGEKHRRSKHSLPKQGPKFFVIRGGKNAWPERRERDQRDFRGASIAGGAMAK